MVDYKIIAENAIKFTIYASGKPVGHIVMCTHGNVLQFEKKDVFTLHGNSDITSDFVDILFNACSENDLTVASKVYEKESVLNHIRALLLHSKFNYDPNIVNYTKSNDQKKSPYGDDYTLEWYLSNGEERFMEILKQCCVNDPNHTPETIVKEYQIWKDNKFDNSQWKLATKGDELLGIILPMRNNNFPNVGNITYIGVLPDKRKAGHGVKLHCVALDILFNDLQVNTYLGMTHKENKGMISILEINKCEFQDVIVFNTEKIK